MSTYGSGNIIAAQTAPNTYTITQPPVGSNLPPSSHLAQLGLDVRDHSGINFSFGPITLTGYVDTANFGVGVEVKLFGISLGTFYGDLKKGLGIAIDVIAAKGNVSLQLEGHAVFVTIKLTPVWGSGVNIHQKLFDLPLEESQKGRNRQSLKY